MKIPSPLLVLLLVLCMPATTATAHLFLENLLERFPVLGAIYGLLFDPVCGDGVCQLTESCPDCAECCSPPHPTVCGNGVCEDAPGEDCYTCAQDCGSCPSPPPSGAYEFLAIGDVPYSAYELCAVALELAKLEGTSSARFLQHLGDIFDGQEANCDLYRYAEVATAFAASPVPVHFIPGDNAFTDCPSVEAAYANWIQAGLFAYSDRFFAFEPTVVRGPQVPYLLAGGAFRDEFYYFVDEGILFVGVSLPGGSGEPNEVTRDQLVAQSRAWTAHALRQESSRRFVVIFGHKALEEYFSQTHSDGLDQLVADRPDKHFLFMTDSHPFGNTYPFRGFSNLEYIKTDDTVTPISIYIDKTRTDTGDVFTYRRGCYCTTKHRPTRLVEWPVGHVCEGACDGTHAACSGQETCSPDANILTGNLYTCEPNPSQTDCLYNGIGVPGSCT